MQSLGDGRVDLALAHGFDWQHAADDDRLSLGLKRVIALVSHAQQFLTQPQRENHLRG